MILFNPAKEIKKWDVIKELCQARDTNSYQQKDKTCPICDGWFRGHLRKVYCSKPCRTEAFIRKRGGR